MKLIFGDLFDPRTYSILLEPDAIAVTTNGFVTKDKRAVMGRGCAKQAASRWTDLPRVLGEKIATKGNIPHVLGVVRLPLRHGNKPCVILSFPVKPKEEKVYKNDPRSPSIVPGFSAMAQLGIIEESVRRILNLCDRKQWKVVVLPRPGVGNGKLVWRQVEPIVRQLDDRFYVITNE